MVLSSDLANFFSNNHVEHKFVEILIFLGRFFFRLWYILSTHTLSLSLSLSISLSRLSKGFATHES